MLVGWRRQAGAIVVLADRGEENSINFGFAASDGGSMICFVWLLLFQIYGTNKQELYHEHIKQHVSNDDCSYFRPQQQKNGRSWQTTEFTIVSLTNCEQLLSVRCIFACIVIKLIRISSQLAVQDNTKQVQPATTVRSLAEYTRQAGCRRSYCLLAGAVSTPYY